VNVCYKDVNSERERDDCLVSTGFDLRYNAAFATSRLVSTASSNIACVAGFIFSSADFEIDFFFVVDDTDIERCDPLRVARFEPLLVLLHVWTIVHVRMKHVVTLYPLP
jgi:hypothetical protein